MLNVRYHDSHLVIIDVSQSVEHDHPSAYDFLRSDLKNADDFFARKGVRTLGVKKTFGFVTGFERREIAEQSDEIWKKDLLELLEKNELEEDEEEEEGEEGGERQNTGEEEVFAASYIPRALNEVYDVERDVEKLLSGKGDGLIYRGLLDAGVGAGTPLVDEKKGVRFNGVVEDNGAEENGGQSDSGSERSSESESGSGNENEDEEEGDEKERRPKGKKFEDKEEKKVRLFFPSPL